LPAVSSQGIPDVAEPRSQTPPELDPRPAEPFLTPEIHQLRRLAQDRILGKQSPPGPQAMPYGPAPTADASVGSDAGVVTQDPTYFGQYVPVENEAALESFHRALGRLATARRDKKDTKKVRMLAYGASHTQADVYTGYLRRYLQSRFGDGGQGFVLLGKVNSWHRMLDTKMENQSLGYRHAHYKNDVENEPLGLFGAAFVGTTKNAYGEIIVSHDSPNTRFELHYYRQPKGGDVEIMVDGQVVATVPTESETEEPAYYGFEATAGAHAIRVRLVGNGSVRLFGITAETDSPGVVVDTLGIGGTRMPSALRWSESVWADAIRRRDPVLVTFAYGTNEAGNTAMAIAPYEQRVREVLARLRRAAPQTSCVLMAPFDFPLVHDDTLVRRPVLERIVQAQRRIAKDMGCGFWDGYAFMGGAGSMKRWASANPPLASGDHIHLTRLGYTYVGIALADALMRRYDENPRYWAELSAQSP